MNRPKLIAVISTVLFHAAVLLLMLFLFLRYSPEEIEQRTWPPVDEDELLYGGEYVMLGDDSEVLQQTDNSDTEPSPEINTAPDVTASIPSETPPPQPQGIERPKPEVDKSEKIDRQQRNEVKERISNRVNFGSSNGDGGVGGKSPGAKNGNANTGSLAGMPGFDLHGRTLASWSKPSGTATGKIVVQVHVNRKGKVTKAEYVSGSGAIASNPEARRSCEKAALQSAFSVADNAPVDQVGHITYRFE